jgi:hypothetical protein
VEPTTPIERWIIRTFEYLLKRAVFPITDEASGVFHPPQMASLDSGR